VLPEAPTAAPAPAPVAAAAPSAEQVTAQAPSAAGPSGPPVSGQRQRAWLPFAIAGAVVFAMVTVAAGILLAVGGSADESAKAAPKPVFTPQQAALAARKLYVQIQGQRYAAVLPAGWAPMAVAKTPVIRDAFAVRSAQNERASLTIGERPSSSGTLGDGARGLRGALTGGASTTYFGKVLFPGKRPAWRTNWSANGLNHVAYLVDVCYRRYLVHAVAPAADFEALKQRFGFVAAGLQPAC